MTQITMANRKVLICVIGRCSTQHNTLQELEQLPWKGNALSAESILVRHRSGWLFSIQCTNQCLTLRPDTLRAQSCDTGDKRKVEAQQINLSCRSRWMHNYDFREIYHQYFLTASAKKEPHIASQFRKKEKYCTSIHYFCPMLFRNLILTY